MNPIRSEAEYYTALKEMEDLMDAEIGSLGEDRLDALATAVVAYEAEHFPIGDPTPIGAEACGRVWKAGEDWLVEVPLLDLMTQGKTKAHALEMIVAALESLVNRPGFKAFISTVQGETFKLASNAAPQLTALLLRRRREAAGITLNAVSEDD